MLIILSKKEYDDLVQKAHAAEVLVEQRVAEERAKILDFLYKEIAGLAERNRHDPYTFFQNLPRILQHFKE